MTNLAKDLFGRLKFRPGKQTGLSVVRPPVPADGGEELDALAAGNLNRRGGRLTSQLIARILEDADAGQPSEQAFLFSEVLEKDPVIGAHLQTRRLAALARGWRIEGPDEEKNRRVTEILERADMPGLINHLLGAAAFGYAGSAAVWAEGGAAIERFVHVHPENWVFDQAGNPALLSAKGGEKSLASYPAGQFVFMPFRQCGGTPQTGGLLRRLVWIYFLKHHAVRDRARFLEKFGIPLIMAKISREDFESEARRNIILNSLSRAGSDGAGVVTDGADLQISSPNISGAGRDFHLWIEYLDDVCALSVLGQTATSGDGGGFSKGQPQENVRMDILRADCASVCAVITAQILAPLEKWLLGTSGTMRFSIDCRPPEDMKVKAETVKIISQAGFSIAPEWISKTFGVSLLDTKQ
jgi:phage gp29-like protein